MIDEQRRKADALEAALEVANLAKTCVEDVSRSFKTALAEKIGSALLEELIGVAATVV
jgi:hypothetical protein